MTTKDWLNRGINLDKEINQLLEEQYKVYSMACRTTSCPSPDKVQTSRNNSSESAFIKYADYSKMIDDRIDELYDIKQEILEAINKVENSTYRTLLIMRYIGFKKWEQIAVEMNYDYYHVIKYLHPRALNEISIPQNTTL